MKTSPENRQAESDARRPVSRGVGRRRQAQRRPFSMRWVLPAVMFAVVTPVTFVLVYSVVSHGDRQSGLADAITELNFRPLKPPNGIWGPGSLYHPQSDGWLSIVCAAEAELLEGLGARAKMTSHEINSQRQLEVSVASKLMRMIETTLQLGSAEATIAALNDAELFHIPGDQLNRITNRLQSRKDCRKEIDARLSRREKVCQGEAALIATGEEIRIIDERITGNGESSRGVAHMVLGSGSKATDEEIFHVMGSQLYYGIRLRDRCLLPPEEIS